MQSFAMILYGFQSVTSRSSELLNFYDIHCNRLLYTIILVQISWINFRGQLESRITVIVSVMCDLKIIYHQICLIWTDMTGLTGQHFISHVNRDIGTFKVGTVGRIQFCISILRFGNAAAKM